MHEELGSHFDNNVLTYSSIRCFQTCPRKYSYRYELGIRRKGEPEREPLVFGRLWHMAMEGYWNALIPKEKPNATDTKAGASEVALPF